MASKKQKLLGLIYLINIVFVTKTLTTTTGYALAHI